MKIEGLSFHQWCFNHKSDHDAKWCRELYPWHVFRAIKYGHEHIAQEQNITFNDTEYTCTITNITKGKIIDRLEIFIDIRSRPLSGIAMWYERQWSSIFRMIVSTDGHFITLFTEDKDPSKVILIDFMNGNFEKIERHRSAPMVDMLFRSIVSCQLKEIDENLDYGSTFDWDEPWLRDLPVHPDLPIRRLRVAPIACQGRELWIHCIISEEKAHRFAINAARQCKELLVIYLLPTLTKHHRCNFPGVRIISLSKFISDIDDRNKIKYLRQARHLLDDMRIQGLEASNKPASELLKIALALDKGPDPTAGDLREAKSALEWDVFETDQAAYFFAAANLINATLRRPELSRRFRLSKDVYSFKKRVAEVIDQCIEHRISEIKIDLHEDGLTMITIHDVQFSFHAIPRTDMMKMISSMPGYTPSPWKGKRLQHIAVALLDWGRACLVQASTQ
jgi:hypothetical protein